MAGTLSTTFSRWGVPPEPVILTPRAMAHLVEVIGQPEPRPAVPVADVQPPPTRAGAALLAALAGAVGPHHVSTDRETRLLATAGSSLADLLRRRAGDVADAPDAVVAPAGHDEVAAVLAAAEAHGAAVVTLGGGTSVVGGVRMLPGPFAAVVALSTHRMDAVGDPDPVSCTVVVGPGVTGPVLERLLQARGFTLGHLPQSWERASIGGYVATRSAGQASSGYGRSDEMVEAVRVATPRGELRLGHGPSSAAGPDLRALVVGSEGVLGVITEVTLRVRHLPSTTRYEGIFLPSWQAGLDAFRVLAQAGLKPDVMRLSDPFETAATMAMSGPTGRAADAIGAYLRVRGAGSGVVAILGWEGTAVAVPARRSAAWALLKRHGAVSVGRKVGESWKHGRYSGPYLRDVLLDEGFLVETLETATEWSRLPALHERLGETLRGALFDGGPGPLVMSHVSHVYETGASLYVTVLARAGDDPAGRWAHAKRAATDLLAGAGATITHHHAVGRDHAPWLEREVGPLGVGILRAVKAELDPAGILNPGVLLTT